jgi:hypothetical protein
MCPFLTAFRHPLILALTAAQANPDNPAHLPPQVTADLKVWANVVASSAAGLPIPHRPTAPSPLALTFVSDTAGARFIKSGGRFVPYAADDNRSAVSIGLNPAGNIDFYATVMWPRSFLLHARDSSDHAYGCKSTTLEAIALLLPFLCQPSPTHEP